MKRVFFGVIVATALAVSPLVASADVAVAVGIAPPALPVYVQPPIPGPGYIWTPGYWAWNDWDEAYFWVPGTWIFAPFTGALWTPGYWGWGAGHYFWHGGYWGTQIGYYGGINYGFGYFGVGYQGGYWNHGSLYYNHAVNNFGNTHIANFYSSTVVNNMSGTRASYNGGTGGVHLAPNSEQKMMANAPHFSPTSAQMQHEQTAQTMPQMRASVNGGAPAIAATSEAGRFNAQTAVPAKNQPKPAANEPGRSAPQYAQRPVQLQTQNYQMPRAQATPQHVAARPSMSSPPTMHYTQRSAAQAMQRPQFGSGGHSSSFHSARHSR